MTGEPIALAGATGVLGRRVVRRLVARGHRVTGLVRSERAAATLAALGAGALRTDVFSDHEVRAAVAGHAAVVNLLTAIPPPARAARPSAWRDNDRLRREASRVLAAAAAATGAERFVQESLALLYADGGARWLDEDAPLAPAGPAAAAADAEANARAAGDAVILRFGILVAPESDQTRAQVAAARRGISLQAGRRAGHLPTVWADDAADAVLAALEAPRGTYNVVEDDPPTRARADASLAAAVGRGRLRAPLAVAGRVGPARLLARSQRLSNARLRAATGWAPAVSLPEAWARVAHDAGAGPA